MSKQAESTTHEGTGLFTATRAQKTSGSAGSKLKSSLRNSTPSTFTLSPLAASSVDLQTSVPLPPPLSLPFFPSISSSSSSFFNSTSTFLFERISPLINSACADQDATYTNTCFNAKRPTKRNRVSGGQYSTIPATDQVTPSYEKEPHLLDSEKSDSSRKQKRVSFLTPINFAFAPAAVTASITTATTNSTKSYSMFKRHEPLDDDEPLLSLVSNPGMKDDAHLDEPNMSIESGTSSGSTSSTSSASTIVTSTSLSTPLKDNGGFELRLGHDDVSASTGMTPVVSRHERRSSIALSVCSSAHSDEDDVPTPEAIREAARDKRRLKLAIGLCTTFFCVELAGGIFADSLALLSDSFHLLTDIMSFCISLAAIYFSQRLPTATHTFGYHRAEVLGALFSIFLIWGLTCMLVIEAYDRVRHPIDIDGKTMSIVAALGVFVNICLMFVLGGHHHHHGDDDHHHHGHEEEGSHSHNHAAHHHLHSHSHSHDRDHSCAMDEHDMKPLSKYQPQGEEVGMLNHDGSCGDDDDEEDDAMRVAPTHKNLNITAATLHVLGDLLSSIGVLISSLLITFFPAWTILDPICTFIFSFLVILTTIGVFKRSVSILMEQVPSHLSVEEAREAIRAVPGVLEVKRVHLWSLTVSHSALTARVYLQPDIMDTAQAAKTVRAIRRMLRRKYGIRQSTIQLEVLREISSRTSSKQQQQQHVEDESSSTSPSSLSNHDHYHHHHKCHSNTHSHHHHSHDDGRAPERHDVDIIFSVGDDEDGDDTTRNVS
ncbi:hypothetical protein BGW41_002170 [Actinomortierella wolfii]|nr:hypothetical protein BGW41_002170 [Actinomortierella wolfii]